MCGCCPGECQREIEETNDHLPLWPKTQLVILYFGSFLAIQNPEKGSALAFKFHMNGTIKEEPENKRDDRKETDAEDGILSGP